MWFVEDTKELFWKKGRAFAEQWEWLDRERGPTESFQIQAKEFELTTISQRALGRIFE